MEDICSRLDALLPASGTGASSGATKQRWVGLEWGGYPSIATNFNQQNDGHNHMGFRDTPSFRQTLNFAPVPTKRVTFRSMPTFTCRGITACKSTRTLENKLQLNHVANKWLDGQMNGKLSMLRNTMLGWHMLPHWTYWTECPSMTAVLMG